MRKWAVLLASATFLRKKMKECADLSDFCSIFARELKGNDYEAIRRISALRREHHEGQGL